MRGTYMESRPRFYDGPSFIAAESNRNGGISNCNVIRHERKKSWHGRGKLREERTREWVERENEKKEGGWERTGGCRTKDKECGTQGVTRISFDGITWRLRAGTVIALVVYR